MSGKLAEIETVTHLKSHLKVLTETIGERSVRSPENLARTQQYIETFFGKIGIPVHSESYPYGPMTAANVIAEISTGPNPLARYVLGAHYDSVSGTVGADDNASGVAVVLETARNLSEMVRRDAPGVSVAFVAFALEEPPAFGTPSMGSRVFARKAKASGRRIDGMICLEMVGYTCRREGCQSYPFPLMFMNYPKLGDFIGIVGNFSSRRLSREIHSAFQENPLLPSVRLTVPFSGRLLPSIRLSDHSSFWDEGYRAAMITDSAFYRNPHYHQPSDTADTLDFGFMAQLVKGLTAFFSSTR